jgi:hypothetical protein
MQSHKATHWIRTHSQSICNLTSTSELEGSQAKHYHGKHIPKVLNTLQDPSTLLFIEGGRKLSVIPFFRALTALSNYPQYTLGLSVIQKTSRWCVTDSPWGPDGLSEVKGWIVRHLRMDRPTPGRTKTHLCLKLDQFTDCPSITRGLSATFYFQHNRGSVKRL